MIRCPKTFGKYDNIYSLTASYMFSKLFMIEMSPQSRNKYEIFDSFKPVFKYTLCHPLEPGFRPKFQE